MNVAAVQGRLNAAGYACRVDGAFGPMTCAALLGFAAARPLGQLGQALGQGLAAAYPAGAIASDLQLAHWVAQATYETTGFRNLVELGGPTYCAQYDGRFGNDQPGDGYRFRGRGPFMLTFRPNYQRYGAAVGEDLVANPDLAARPDLGVRIACAFWHDRAIGALADADDLIGVTRKINGGENGLADRGAILARLKTLIGA